jgi:hypothetical protein
VRKADNLPPSCVVTKSGGHNFLEPSGPVQACNGTSLPFTIGQKFFCLFSLSTTFLLLISYQLLAISYKLNKEEFFFFFCECHLGSDFLFIY